MSLKRSLSLSLFLAATPLLAQTDAPPPPAPPVCKCPCPCPEPPPPPLTGSLGAGLSVTTGNSDTTAFNLAFGLVYDPKTHNLFKADAFWLYSKSEGEATADKAGARIRYEYKFTERIYGFGQVAYLRDRFKNVTYLIAPMAGAGYLVLKQTNLELGLDGSLGGAFEKDSGYDATSSGAFAVGQSFLWKISPAATLTQKASGLWKMDDTSDYFLHFDIGVAATLTKSFEMKISWLVDYKNKPLPATLNSTDTAFIAAILYKF